MAAVRLTDLLPTNGYLLPYALSLFFISFVLTFSGAFLTLDRTRSFAPTGDVFQDKRKSTSRLVASFFRGGLGGILTGFFFGIHFATFLSLLIPSVTPSQTLKPASYLTVWLLPSLATSVAAGRWKYFSFIASGLCGGTSLALAVSVTIHPSLLTRIVLVAVFSSTLAALTPIPIPRLQPVLLRISSSAAGSFGLVISIALFTRIEPWSNVWERLWVQNDIQWGTAQEKGLSAGFFLFLAFGVSTDWWLRTKFGENPDQKWDSYLAQYVANLPEESNRAGIFHPVVAIWSKPPFKFLGPEPIISLEEPDINCLREGKRDKWMGNDRILKTKARGNIKFRPLDDEDSTDSETEAGHISKGEARHMNPHPWLAGVGPNLSTHSSASTVSDNGVHSHALGEKDPHQVDSRSRLSTDLEMYDLPDYSDREVDITTDFSPTRHGPDLMPRFHQNTTLLHKLPASDVNVTPPLDASVSSTSRHGPHQDNPGDSLKRHESPRWQAFWKDVNEKIRHKEIR